MYEPNIDVLLLYYNFNRKGNVLILKFIITTCVRHKLYNYAMLLMPIKYNFNSLSTILTLLDLCQFGIITRNTFSYRYIPGDLPVYFLVPTLVFTWACILN